MVFPSLAWVVILTLGLLIGWEYCLRGKLTRFTVIHFLFLTIGTVPVGAGAIALLGATPKLVPLALRARWFWPVTVAVCAVPLLLALRRPRRASRLMRSGLLYSWPVLILILFAAVRGSLLLGKSDYADGPFAPPFPASPDRPRVVWIIFDELSQTIAFGNRPPGLSLPNLDRLKQESFYATAAEPPGATTLVSLPSLIVGQKVLEAANGGPRDLLLKLESKPGMVPWGSLPNVFDSARDLGFNTALVGWYHPYGRVLHRSLTECYWTSGWEDPAIVQPVQPESFADSMRNRIREELLTLPLAGHLPGAPRETFIRRQKLVKFTYLDGRARQVVSDPGIGLALIHLPVPNPPAIFDRADGALSYRLLSSYEDDMALVDLELGRLRQAIEDAGLGARTAILVSADHGWRTYSWRGTVDWTSEDEALSHQDTLGIPFLLKLPGQTAGSVYGQRFNTVITRRTITAILNGQLSDPAAIAALIESGGR